jgi:hypothetical protein
VREPCAGESRARRGIFRTAISLVLKKSPSPLSLKAIHECVRPTPQKSRSDRARIGIRNVEIDRYTIPSDSPSPCRSAALADPKARSILALSNGKTHSNSLTSMCSKDVQKGRWVEVQGVQGLCKIGTYFIRCGRFPRHRSGVSSGRTVHQDEPLRDETRPAGRHGPHDDVCARREAVLSNLGRTLPQLSDRWAEDSRMVLMCRVYRLPCSNGGKHLYHLKSQYDGLISLARKGQFEDSTATKRSATSSDESTRTSPRRVRARSCTSSCSSESEVDTTNLDLLADTAVSRGANLDSDEDHKSAPAKRWSEQSAPSRKTRAWSSIVSELSMDETMKRFSSTCALSNNDCRHVCCRSWAPTGKAAADVQ